MGLYFCINHVLDNVEAATGPQPLRSLCEVSAAVPACDGHAEDAFILSSRPTLMDLDAEQGAAQLAQLLDKVPLYRLNMELALDEALMERRSNKTVAAALNKAFGNALPHTFHNEAREPDDLNGSLRHPMLEHIERPQLCKIYLDFIRHLGASRPYYSFESNILGKHPEPFTQHFDGFIIGGRGKVRADILIGFGLRLDHDPGKPLENYVAGGQKRAHKMDIGEARELIWAWLEADHYQMRRCRDMHRMKLVPGLPRAPNWIKADIFALLEKEAVKQHFAETLKKLNPDLPLLEKLPALKRAVAANADGQVDELLQKLLSQTLNIDAPYSGAAGKFADAAEKRMTEAQTARLV